jgi:LacI family transcriptional regulator
MMRIIMDSNSGNKSADQPAAKVAATKDPTIKDVAKHADVSIATVSRVLNNLSGYSDETRRKVDKAIQELGYQPNAIARGLINKRTQTIGVLFPSVSSLFSSDILRGIEEYANDQGYSVFVCNTDKDGLRTAKYLQVLREKQVDGIIFSSEILKKEYYDTLQAMKVPVVLVSSKTDFASVPYVKVDDRQAAYDAVKYLIDKGHREIAMMSGPKSDPIAGAPRIEGYRQALEDHGIPFRDNYVVDGSFVFDKGCLAMEELLKQTQGVTAIFAAGDEMAIGILSVAAKHGISVPDQLSVIGYDNLKLSEMVLPPLSTVHQPLYEMGKLAVEKLIYMVESGNVANSSIVQHKIVERQTVATLT